MPKKRALIVCTANCIRSQMGEGLWNHHAPDTWECYSAGASPSGYVHTLAIEVMKEVGIDISDNESKSIRAFDGQTFDVVITVCDSARRECGYFQGGRENLHWPMPDPTGDGSADGKIKAFRLVRDQLEKKILEYLHAS